MTRTVAVSGNWRKGLAGGIDTLNWAQQEAETSKIMAKVNNLRMHKDNYYSEILVKKDFFVSLQSLTRCD